MTDDLSPPKGVIAPLLTPFNDDLTIAADLFVAHALRLLAQGCAAVTPFGTTGEADAIATRERLAALDALIAGGVPAAKIVPGVGMGDFDATLEMARGALERGCAGVLTLPPFSNADAGDAEIYEYYAALVAALGDGAARILLYHIPQKVGLGVAPSVAARLRAAFPRSILGIKDSSGDWSNTEALLAIGDGLAVYPSSETLLEKSTPLGGAGCVSATLNVHPDGPARIYAALARGDAPAPADVERAAGVRAFFVEAGLIGAQKRYLALTTGEPRWATVRPPLAAVDAETGEAQRAALAQMTGFAGAAA